MGTKDELRAIIERSIMGKTVVAGARDATQALNNAGWRPPMGEITTVEELEALPDDTILMDCEDEPSIVRHGELWDANSERHCPFHAMVGCAPFRVVWEPEAMA